MKSKTKFNPYHQISLILLACLFISIIIFYITKIFNHPYYRSDFVSFFSSARILLEHPDSLYDFHLQTQYQLNLLPGKISNIPGNHFYPFINPPFFLLPYLVLINLDLQLAYSIIIASIILVVFICLWLLTSLFPLPYHKRILTALAVLAYAPTFSTIYLSQSSFTTLLIFLITYYLLTQKKYYWAGLASSVLLYKPQLAIVLYLYFILQKPKFLIMGLLTGGIGFFIGSWILAKGHIFNLLFSLPNFMHQIGSGPKIRITWLGFFHQLSDFIPQLPYQPLTYLMSVFIIVWGLNIIIKYRQVIKLRHIFSFIIVLTLLGSVHAHYQETILLFFPLFVYLQEYSSFKFYLLVITGWTVYLLAIFNPFFPQPLLFLPTLYLLLILIVMVKHFNSQLAYRNQLNKNHK